MQNVLYAGLRNPERDQRIYNAALGKPIKEAAEYLELTPSTVRAAVSRIANLSTFSLMLVGGGKSLAVGPVAARSFLRGLQIRIGAGDKINDVDRIIKTLDGKQFKARETEYAMNTAFNDGAVFEDDYYRAKAFKNGNLHIEFKRADLLDGLNEQIALYYGNALGKEK
jgi:hypothetical protein